MTEKTVTRVTAERDATVKDFARATWIVFQRDLTIGLRNPVWVLIGLANPILYLALFGPLLKKVVESTPGLPSGDAWQIFVPGLLVQLAMFGAAFVGFGLIAEYRAGVIERMRVTPAPRSALLVGRVLRDLVVVTIQGALFIVVAVPFGLRAPVLGLLLGLVLVGLLGAAFAALSYAVALRVKSEDALAPILNGLALPLLLLSGILLPMSIAPTWLQALSDVNPIKHAVDGMRAAFRGDYSIGGMGWGLGAVFLMLVLGLGLGLRTFQRESA